jgi:hypothetical protein
MPLSDRDYMRGEPTPRRRPAKRMAAQPMADAPRTFAMPRAKVGSALWWRALAYHAGEPGGLVPALSGGLLTAAAVAWFAAYAPRDPAAFVWARPAWTWAVMLGLALGGAVALERCCWVQVRRLGVAAGAAAGFVSFFAALSLIEVEGGSRTMQGFDELLPMMPWWGLAAWSCGALLAMGAARRETRQSLTAASVVSLVFAGVCAASKLLA